MKIQALLAQGVIASRKLGFTQSEKVETKLRFSGSEQCLCLSPLSRRGKGSEPLLPLHLLCVATFEELTGMFLDYRTILLARNFPFILFLVFWFHHYLDRVVFLVLCLFVCLFK